MYQAKNARFATAPSNSLPAPNLASVKKQANASFDNRDERYLRQSQIVGKGKLLPVAPSTFRRYIKSGLLPSPTKLSPGVSVWKASDIHAFLAQAGGQR